MANVRFITTVICVLLGIRLICVLSDNPICRRDGGWGLKADASRGVRRSYVPSEWWGAVWTRSPPAVGTPMVFLYLRGVVWPWTAPLPSLARRTAGGGAVARPTAHLDGRYRAALRPLGAAQPRTTRADRQHRTLPCPTPPHAPPDARHPTTRPASTRPAIGPKVLLHGRPPSQVILLHSTPKSCQSDRLPVAPLRGFRVRLATRLDEQQRRWRLTPN